MPSETHEQFCGNLDHEIKRAKITQKQFADRLGVSEAYVSQILSGRKAPGLDLVDRLAKALDIKPSRLFRSPVEAT